LNAENREYNAIVRAREMELLATNGRKNEMKTRAGAGPETHVRYQDSQAHSVPAKCRAKGAANSDAV